MCVRSRSGCWVRFVILLVMREMYLEAEVKRSRRGADGCRACGVPATAQPRGSPGDGRGQCKGLVA